MKISLLMLIAVLWAAPAFAATPIPDAETPAAKIYAEKCGICHSLPHPKRLYFEQWQHMLKLMYRRMAERGMKQPSAQEQAAIADYLKQHAR